MHPNVSEHLNLSELLHGGGDATRVTLGGGVVMVAGSEYEGADSVDASAVRWV